MKAIEELEKAKSSSTSHANTIEHMLNIASMFDRLSDKSMMNGLVAQFHNFAGQCPYINDRDIGALVLEITAMNSPGMELQKRLLEEAAYRASWCAQSASSGGEGASRAEHLYRLLKK